MCAVSGRSSETPRPWCARHRGSPFPCTGRNHRHHERTRVLRDKRSSRTRKLPIINGMIRANRQREAEVPDDRRLQEFPHNEGRLDHVAVPRSGFPCPSVQVSRATWKSLCIFLSISLLLGSRNPPEPVGSVRPKFPSVSNINGLITSMNGTLPLLCPAQGFPVPSYRYYITECLDVTSVLKRISRWFSIKELRLNIPYLQRLKPLVISNDGTLDIARRSSRFIYYRFLISNMASI